MSSKLVELSDITAGYDDFVAIEHVNFHINENDYIGIIGPNGGGKTTLLKVILGILAPFAGKVNLHGSNDGKRDFIGYLPQVSNIDKKFPITVQEVVLSGIMSQKTIFGRYSQADADKVRMLLAQTGIDHLRNKVIGELSGGQMQRAFLCRALIAKPRLLILDEPNTYVDNKFEGELYELLGSLNKEMAIVIVTHDLGTVSKYVKSIACVNRQLHYHPSNIISQEQLNSYNCPIQLITHGHVPHTVLENHPNKK